MVQQEHDGTITLSLNRFFPHNREQIWRALTTPEFLCKWWAKGDIAPIEGHEFSLDMNNWGLVPCKIIEVKPEEKLSFSFGKWTIIWQLVDEDGGTRLYLEQRGLDPNNPQDRFAIENMESGWKNIVLENLEKLLKEV